MVKCKDCGILAMREYVSRELVETEQCIRVSGKTPPVPSGSRVKKYEDMPLCMAGEIDFSYEAGKTKYPSASDRISSVCVEERECDQFIPWQIGFSPKEHVDMSMLKEQREEFRRNRETDERNFELQMKLHKEIADSSRVNALVCALVGIGAALAGAVTMWVLSGMKPPS